MRPHLLLIPVLLLAAAAAADAAQQAYFGSYGGTLAFGYTVPSGGYLDVGVGTVVGPQTASSSFTPDQTVASSVVYYAHFAIGTTMWKDTFSRRIGSSNVYMGRGWISGASGTLTFIPDRAQASQTIYLSSYRLDSGGLYRRDTYSTKASGETPSVTLGRGWLQGADTGYDFTPDRGQPSAAIYYSQFAISSVSSRITFSTTQPSSYALVMTAGWISGHAGAQTLISDRAKTPSTVYLGRFSVGSTTTVDTYDTRASTGYVLRLGQGWIEGPDTATSFVPSQAVASQTVYLGNYQISSTSSVVGYALSAASQGTSYAMGRGWISGTGTSLQLVVDTAAPSADTWYANFPLGGIGNLYVQTYTHTQPSSGMYVGRCRIWGPAVSANEDPDFTVPKGSVYHGWYPIGNSQSLNGYSRNNVSGATLAGSGWIRGRSATTTLVTTPGG